MNVDPNWVIALPGIRQAPMPNAISPMLATLTREPFSDPAWIFEPKLDGFRAITLHKGGVWRILSRRGKELTHYFRSIITALGSQSSELILDGEIIALEPTGKVCFECLQQTIGMQVERATRHPPGKPRLAYYVFDILFLDGYDLRNVPLTSRKLVLAENIRLTSPISRIEYFREDGFCVFNAALGQGFEGVIGKKLDSMYEPGKRSRNWLKVKASIKQDFLVGGYTTDKRGRFTGLLVGYYDIERHLRFAGAVGIGFKEADVVTIMEKLDKIPVALSPFADMPELNTPVKWVHPALVAEVRFVMWTHGGYLRDPVFLRLNMEKQADEVHVH